MKKIAFINNIISNYNLKSLIYKVRKIDEGEEEEKNRIMTSFRFLLDWFFSSSFARSIVPAPNEKKVNNVPSCIRLFTN